MVFFKKIKVIDLKKEIQGFSLKAVGIIIVITAIVTSITTGIIIYNNNKENLVLSTTPDDLIYIIYTDPCLNHL